MPQATPNPRVPENWLSSDTRYPSADQSQSQISNVDSLEYMKEIDPLSRKGSFVHKHKFHRYPTRTLLLILVPPALAAYFLVVWQVLLTEEIDAVKFGHRNANWVYYSWFIVGVFGLNVSRYGLSGVEAAMLQDPFWSVDNAMVLMMHSEKGWSGLAGWVKCLNSLVRRRGSIAQRLWFLLAFLSLIISIALPLSGLSLELFDGYVKTSAHPEVVGRNWTTFNRRQTNSIADRVESSWKAAAPVTLPGLGVIYTPPNIRRNQFSLFDELPNSLPIEDEGISELFIAPQANVPVNGNAWGLKVSYNCSLVESAAEFTVLKNRSSWSSKGIAGLEYSALQVSPPHNGTIWLFNNTNSYTTRGEATNLWAYGELGYDLIMEPMLPGISGWERSDKPHVIEYALWQARDYEVYAGGQIDFNTTVSPSVSGIGQPIYRAENGTYLVNKTFFNFNESLSSVDVPSLFKPSDAKNLTHLAEPIGVRCVYTSDPGTANLKAQTSTFDSFERVYPNKSAHTEYIVSQFGKNAGEIMWGRFYELFTSTNGLVPLTESNSAMYMNYVTPQVLRQSMMRAFAMDVLQLMYDGINSFESPTVDTNLTSSTAGKILGPGAVPPLIPAILFGIWAVACVLLGCIYGFRQRWSEQLDGFSLFSFGVHMAERVPDRSRLTTGERFDECDELRSIPGMAGNYNISDGVRRRYAGGESALRYEY